MAVKDNLLIAALALAAGGQVGYAANNQKRTCAGKNGQYEDKWLGICAVHSLGQGNDKQAFPNPNFGGNVLCWDKGEDDWKNCRTDAEAQEYYGDWKTCCDLINDCDDYCKANARNSCYEGKGVTSKTDPDTLTDSLIESCTDYGSDYFALQKGTCGKDLDPDWSHLTNYEFACSADLCVCGSPESYPSHQSVEYERKGLDTVVVGASVTYQVMSVSKSYKRWLQVCETSSFTRAQYTTMFGSWLAQDDVVEPILQEALPPHPAGPPETTSLKISPKTCPGSKKLPLPEEVLTASQDLLESAGALQKGWLEQWLEALDGTLEPFRQAKVPFEGGEAPCLELQSYPAFMRFIRTNHLLPEWKRKHWQKNKVELDALREELKTNTDWRQCKEVQYCYESPEKIANCVSRFAGNR